MNYKKETLELLGYEKLPCNIPSFLIDTFTPYFTKEQQYPLQNTEIGENAMLIMSAITNTPQLNTLRSVQSKSSKSKTKAFFPQKWPVSKSNMSPFSFCKFSHFQPLTSRYWYYLDNQNIIQGPFSSVEMDNWYRKNLLNADLLISFKSRDLTSFIKFKDILKESENSKCDNQLISLNKKSSSVDKNKIFNKSNSPASKASTEVSASNNNSCSKKHIWGVDAEYFLGV